MILIGFITLLIALFVPSVLRALACFAGGRALQPVLASEFHTAFSRGVLKPLAATAARSSSPNPRPGPARRTSLRERAASPRFETRHTPSATAIRTRTPHQSLISAASNRFLGVARRIEIARARRPGFYRASVSARGATTRIMRANALCRSLASLGLCTRFSTGTCWPTVRRIAAPGAFRTGPRAREAMPRYAPRPVAKAIRDRAPGLYFARPLPK